MTLTLVAKEWTRQLCQFFPFTFSPNDRASLVGKYAWELMFISKHLVQRIWKAPKISNNVINDTALSGTYWLLIYFPKIDWFYISPPDILVLSTRSPFYILQQHILYFFTWQFITFCIICLEQWHCKTSLLICLWTILSILCLGSCAIWFEATQSNLSYVEDIKGFCCEICLKMCKDACG